MTRIKVYAWAGGVINFGDELGVHLLHRLGYAIERVEMIEDAELLACGSLLETAAQMSRPGTIVWGTGLMHEGSADLSTLDVRAVRGKLTAAAIGRDVPTCDPGSLVPQLFKRPRVKHDLGVVRHYVDKRAYPWADIVIEATWPVEEVIAAIGSCRRIASSSLHGLIVAAAWDIPTLRLHHSEVAGGDFKWSDWFTGDHDVDALVRCLP